MEYFDAAHHLHLHFDAKECTIPSDQMSRMQRSLAPLGEAVQDFPNSELSVSVLRHPRQEYHVEARLKVPGRTLFSTDRDPFLDSAFQRCVRKLTRNVFECRGNLDLRFIFQDRSDCLYVSFLGNHDEVRALLRNKKY